MSSLTAAIVVIGIVVAAAITAYYVFNGVYYMLNPNTQGFDFWQNLVATGVAIIVTLIVLGIFGVFAFAAGVAAS